MPKTQSCGDLSITRRFVDRWSRRYDRFAGLDDLTKEADLLNWLDSLGDAKYLDRDHFVELCMWKSPRQKSRYESNDSGLIERVTHLAHELDEDLLKLHVLTALEGVGVPVASTILYFLHPGQFPIFDVRARSSLAKARQWKFGAADQSLRAWLSYVKTMRDLSRKLDVSLRRLDKALFAYDKWPTNPLP